MTPKKASTPKNKRNGTKNAPQEEHEELKILDSLGLADEKPTLRLKHALLDNGPDVEDSKSKLGELMRTRTDEGSGETLFDIGLEDSGESMGFTKQEWDAALARICDCAKALQAEVRILMTRNVGGEHDLDSTQGQKDKSCSGKVIIRKHPQNLDEVIETRIAVVGNGELSAADSPNLA